MSNSEKIQTWKGEKVILPKDPDTSASEKFYFGRDDYPGYGDHRSHQWHRPGNLEEGIPRSVGGSTGVIVEVVVKDPLGPWGDEVTIQLDGSGERIVLASVAGVDLGFQAEMATAQGLVGQSWFSKGKNLLLTSSGERVWINNLERLTLSRVDWNYAPERMTPEHMTISWYFKNDRGVEGKLDGERVYADSRFHTSFNAKSFDEAAAHLYTRRFHTRDPRAEFAGWSKATWELIDKGVIAIGMSTTMAALACGEELEEAGAILSTAGAVAPILSCGRQRFLVENGKVTKYVESQ